VAASNDDHKHDTDPAVANTQDSADIGSAATSHASSSGASTSMNRAPRMVRAGDTLGRYQIGDELGEGGMATVFKARDTELRRDVAVKVLFPHLARRDETVRRFQREARTAAGLDHKNIMRIYDVGGAEGDDPPYIVMELVRGRSLLAELEQRGPMLSEIVACIGAVLADALVQAHAAGIIHRDIKPANVLVTHDGRVLLADFGVARLETEDSLHTKTGALLGTPAYMSPEQASGDIAVARSDLYSLGAMLYQLSTGSLPFTGNPAKMLAQIASGALVPAIRRRAAVGPDLSRCITELMAVEQEARPANATVVAAELRRIASVGGFGDPADELVRYFTDPEAFARDRLPGVVTAMITSAKQAIADSKLPRAIALADRAAALAPDDPQVAALVQTVTEGGRASARRKVVLLVGAGLLVAGGGTVAAMSLFGGDETPQTIDAPVALVADAPADAPAVAVIADAGVIAVLDLDAGLDAAAIASLPVDARPAKLKDASVAVTIERPDAEVALATPDAFVPVDAPPAPPEDGSLVVENDTWCSVYIDGSLRGEIKAKAKPVRITLAPGSYQVTCEQTANKRWTKPVTVKAGKQATLKGELLGAGIAVTIAIAGDRATIGGTSYVRGATATIPAGRVQMKVYKGAQVVAEGWISVVRPCKAHEDGPRVVCDPI